MCKMASGEGHPLSVLTVTYRVEAPGSSVCAANGFRGAPLAAQLSGPKEAIESICELNHELLRRTKPRQRPGGRAVIKMRRAQLSFCDGLIHEE